MLINWNFFSIIAVGYILIACLVGYFFMRDSFRSQTFLGKHKKITQVLTALLLVSALITIYARFIEPRMILIRTANIKIVSLQKPIKIALGTDFQLNINKQSEWTQKIVDEINEIKPDLILLGGDIIDNEGATSDEIEYMEPLRQLAGKYKIFYIMGNHEYGLGRQTRDYKDQQSGDKSIEFRKKMTEIGIPELKNQLVCPEINGQKICIYGIDDIWIHHESFIDLENWDTKTPLIFLTHNPDGILEWPAEIKKPDLVFSGHTHGGQIWLPLLGPMGNAGVKLGKNYYYGLKNFQGTPMYITSGLGESGGPVRFLAWPEIAVIKLGK